MLAPIQRARIGFSFQLPQGTGRVDGVAGSGLLGSSTGANGCAVATVVTSGLGASTDDAPSGVLRFFFGGAGDEVDIIVNLATLQASPSFIQVGADPVTRTITLTARDTAGNAVSGVQISGTCTVSGSGGGGGGGGGGATIVPSSYTGVTSASGTAQHDHRPGLRRQCHAAEHAGDRHLRLHHSAGSHGDGSPRPDRRWLRLQPRLRLTASGPDLQRGRASGPFAFQPRRRGGTR